MLIYTPLKSWDSNSVQRRNILVIDYEKKKSYTIKDITHCTECIAISLDEKILAVGGGYSILLFNFQTRTFLERFHLPAIKDGKFIRFNEGILVTRIVLFNLQKL